MNFTQKDIEDKSASIIELSGSIIGGSQAIEFTKTVGDFCSTNKQNLIIDLSQVDVLNSSGLGMLVSAYTTSKKYNRNFTLTSVSDKIFNIFAITQLDKVLSFEDSTDSALNKI
jgi:anti-sigma B factor antagonist